MSDYIPFGYQTLKQSFERYGQKLHGSAWSRYRITDDDAKLIGLQYIRSGHEILGHIEEQDALRYRKDQRFIDLKAKVKNLDALEQVVWTKLQDAFFCGTLTASKVGIGGFTSVPSDQWASMRFDGLEFSDSFDRAPYLVEIDAFERFLENDRVTKVRPRWTDGNELSNEDVDRPRKAKGGRPEEYDWLAIYVEIARYLYEEAPLKNRSELTKKILHWYPTYLDNRREGDRPRYPSESKVKAAVSAFWKAFKKPN